MIGLNNMNNPVVFFLSLIYYVLIKSFWSMPTRINYCLSSGIKCKRSELGKTIFEWISISNRQNDFLSTSSRKQRSVKTIRTKDFRVKNSYTKNLKIYLI